MVNKLLALGFLCLLLPHAEAQKKNYAIIQPADNEQSIIQKAATLVPSPRQMRWQQLELTAFFHFGVNAFTDHHQINKEVSEKRMYHFR